MKGLTLLLTYLIVIQSAVAYTTEASRFVEKQYNQNTNSNAKIQVTKEFTNEYKQYLNEQLIPFMVYGYGFMKTDDRKKSKITYICLLDKNSKPFWSNIVSYK